MQGLQKISKDLGRVITKNSTTILTGMGVAGFVSTIFTAVKATPKALQIIEDEKYRREPYGPDEDNRHPSPKYFEPLPKKDIIKLTWKTYLPTAILGTLSIACFVSANSINLRRNAALAGAYSLAETTLKEYRTKVVETVGRQTEKKIREEVTKDKVTVNPPVEGDIIFTGKGDTLCYDAWGGRYFKSDVEYIRRAVNKTYRAMVADDTVLLNDLYYELGLSNTKVGEVMGWHVDDGELEAEFTSQLTERELPCLVLDFNIEPRYMNFN